MEQSSSELSQQCSAEASPRNPACEERCVACDRHAAEEAAAAALLEQVDLASIAADDAEQQCMASGSHGSESCLSCELPTVPASLHSGWLMCWL
jgi:hypothetical protein